MHANRTTQALSNITDPGHFERLATAVLRASSRQYEALTHSGMNAQGKTIKGPLDGIAFVVGSTPPHMIAAHHTTNSLKDMRAKWLRSAEKDLAKSATSQDASIGDVIKTAVIAWEERRKQPDLRVTLALTTNLDPPQELVRDVHEAGTRFGIDVDLWSGSRLAHFLDSPEGQWLRRQYLGIEQEQLSRPLLHKLSQDCLSARRPPDDQPDAWIDREADRALADAKQRDVVFLLANSGQGKTIACYKHLEAHVARGGCGLILSDEVVDGAVTLDGAVEVTLRQLHPSLVAGSGAEARALCSHDDPFVLVVEDVNRSGRARQIVEKIASWGQEKQSGATPYRVLCPVWPRILAMAGEQQRRRIEALSIAMTPLTNREACEALQRRMRSIGTLLTDIEADAVAGGLGCDPLLIALYDPSSGLNPNTVLRTFINKAVMRLAANQSSYTASDYRSALLSLGCEMLAKRTLAPTWRELSEWYRRDTDILNMLRSLVGDGEVVRLVESPQGQSLAFRHDRVRNTILSHAMAEAMRAGSATSNSVSDPYCAEIVGLALAMHELDTAIVNGIAISNPLALFHALRTFREPSSQTHAHVIEGISRWLDSPASKGRASQYLRWYALAELAETDSPYVVGFVQRIGERGWSSWQALFRNGELSGGVTLCFAIEPGSNAPWRDRQIAHAQERFGPKYIQQLDQQLRRSDLDDKLRCGSLRLAGFFAADQLADALLRSWETDPKREEHLPDYLWAAAQCCGDRPEAVLRPFTDAWAALPNKSEKEGDATAREELAAHDVRFAFHRKPPRKAIGYFIQRAQGEDLRWPITYMLDELDDPDAVEFVVHELARMDRQAKEKDSFSPFVMSAPDGWRRREEHGGPPMSAESKSRLEALWSAPGVDPYLRRQSLRLWTGSSIETDIEVLKQFAGDDPLSDIALFERLRRGDESAVSALIDKLKDEAPDGYWWQAGRYIWSESLTVALAEALALRAGTAKAEWGESSGRDWLLSEMIMRRPPAVAEALLLPHWDKLRFSNHFVHAAFYTATPVVLRLAEESVAECPDKTEMFKYIDHHFGFRTPGLGIVRRSQVEGVAPYLTYWSVHGLDHLWIDCNTHGWFDLRRKWVDPLIKDGRYHEYLSQTGTDRALDKFVADGKLVWLDHWLDDFIKSGVSPDEVVNCVASWFSTRRSLKHFELIANALVHIGARRHLALLNADDIEPAEDVAAIRADTTFAVARKDFS